jgi:molybdopterin-biosynthesis enzyme MoeA-like protein
VQVGVEILTSKIRNENGNKFKNGLSKKGVEYF